MREGSVTGTPLSAATLARRAALPVKFAPVTLAGSFVRLAPLDLAHDVDALHAVSNGQPARLGEREIPAYDADAMVWRYMPVGPFADAEDLRAALRVQVEAPNGLCLCVFDVPTGQPIGAVNFMTNMPEHLKVELGSIWYSPLVQRTKANLEATYLMLGHAFDIGYRRVEWKCDSLNERSRRAAMRMGFQFEGIQEYHFIIKGRNRDTAWFRILDHEWPSVKARLEAMLM
jgi:RimJ/RimL family protein N-acetyltransferase